MSLHIVILAAGLGKRMQSALPKVLHPLGGQPMLERVVTTAHALLPEAIHVIIGHGADLIKRALPDLRVNWITQTTQLGTGDAVRQALAHIPLNSHVLVLSADVPLIQSQTLQTLVKRCQDTPSLGLLIASVANPFGLGRIVRNENKDIIAIVEEKDASDEVRQIPDIYSGMCCAQGADLHRWLPNITPNNAQGEYYLTDIIAMAVAEQTPIVSLTVKDHIEIQGVNNRAQLQQLERHWQLRQASDLMHAGVTLADAARIDIRGTLTCEQDVFIDVNTVFIGNNIIGEGCQIGAHCVLTNVTLGARSIIHPNSVLDGCTIGDACQIGPFARVRPGTILADACKIGNFVETKQTAMGEGSKVNHLSYVGDAIIGQHVNIGAGTITCNYDGANKHQTIIEDGAFIGSGTQLVAPVTIGKNATIGAGSTIRKPAPSEALTLSISSQKTIEGWVRPKKHK